MVNWIYKLVGRNYKNDTTIWQHQEYSLAQHATT